MASVIIDNNIGYDYFYWGVTGVPQMSVATIVNIVGSYQGASPSSLSDTIDAVTVNANATDSFLEQCDSGYNDFYFYPGDSFTIYAYRYIVANSNWVYLGSATVNIPSSRPDYFTWTYAGWDVTNDVAITGSIKSSTYNLYVTAAEWNALIANVEDIYDYKGFSSYTPTMDAAVPGTNMLYTHFNQVKNAIGWFYNNSDPPTGIGIPDINAHTHDITVGNLNTLVSKINGVT